MSIRLENGARAQIEINLDNIPPEKIKEMEERSREATAKIKQREAPKPDTPKENNLMNLFASKRIAAVLSILLCIALYLSFLLAFTTKRDTYICYTTKTGTHYHSAICSYLNTAYETTVYEASRKYKPCNYCNPCVEQYKTTITDRNYIIPIFISIPISAAVFLLLTYRKKEK